MTCLADLIEQAKTKHLLSELFEFLFTPDEREDFVKRLALVEALIRGDQTQRDMAKSLGLSVTKITRGSNNIKAISPPLRSLIEQYFEGTGDT